MIKKKKSGYYKFYFILTLFLYFLTLFTAGSALALHQKAGFELEYETWLHNAQMHMQKKQYANALLCYFKAKRFKPGADIDALIEKARIELNKPAAAPEPLPPIPLSDERIVNPLRNPASTKNKKKIKRTQFFRKNYGFFIFPIETMGLREGEFFDYSSEAQTAFTAENSRNQNKEKDPMVFYETKEEKNFKEPPEIKEYFVNIDSEIEENAFSAQTVLRRGIKNGKMIALTFDDGPHPTHTPKILKILEANEVQATFFMLGSRIKEYSRIAASVHAAGHVIGNHSYSHPFYTRIKKEKIDKEISSTNDAIKKITKYKEVKFLRPPYGALPGYVMNKACDENFYIVMWSFDSKDYQGHSVDYMLDKILKRVKSGDVLLFHDIHSNTVKLMKEMIPILKKAGFKFVSLSEIYGLNYTPQKDNKNKKITDNPVASNNKTLETTTAKNEVIEKTDEKTIKNSKNNSSITIISKTGQGEISLRTENEKKSRIRENKEEKVSARDFRFKSKSTSK